MPITVTKEVEFDEEDLNEYLGDMKQSERVELAREILAEDTDEDLLQEIIQNMGEAELVKAIKGIVEDSLDPANVRAVFEFCMDRLAKLGVIEPVRAA